MILSVNEVSLQSEIGSGTGTHDGANHVPLSGNSVT